jgi:hypothetical protein
VKVPPPEKPPTYDKEKGLTRRTVAGAAGGMLGVDYEDKRAPDPSTVKATTGAGSNRDSPAAEVAAAIEIAKESSQKRTGRALAPKDEAEMILDDEDAITREEKQKQRTKSLRVRDRMTVDKDAPQRRRAPSWEQGPPPEEPDEIDLEALAGSIGEHGVSLEERRAFVGDPRLTDPLSIKEALCAPVAYAKHCLILAEAFRATTGATRAETVAYLARMFSGLGDRAFARQALKELGPATGIIDIYPLEVIEHCIETYPGLLLKAGFGTLFVRPRKRSLDLEAGVPETLEYPAGLKIRGFAIKGGGVPGYRFEPDAREGAYTLMIFAPGRYRLLISAITRSGHTVVDRFDAVVRDGPRALPAFAMDEPVRDAEKVDAWPKPEPIPVDYSRMLEDESPARREDSSNMLSSGERISMQQRDHLEVRAEERVEFVDAIEPPQEEDLGIVDPDDTISRAEASLLKLAVVLSTDDRDLSPVPDEEE